jgi:OOP family OmpA-OmpF porin
MFSSASLCNEIDAKRFENRFVKKIRNFGRLRLEEKIWYFLCPLILLWPPHRATAQSFQWAQEVVSYSSQFNNLSYAANQITGPPNAIYQDGLSELAWTPLEDMPEASDYIQVRFEYPTTIRQVLIVENFNPGAISKIVLIDPAGKEYTVFKNEDPQAISRKNRYFYHSFSETSYAVEQLRLELNTSAVYGANQIDAIGISKGLEIFTQDQKTPPAQAETIKKIPLPPVVNTNFDEQHPLISADGKILFFERTDHPLNIGLENNTDIWISYLQENNQWTLPINAGFPLNDRQSNQILSVNPTGNILYLKNDRSGQILQSQLEGRSWSFPVQMPIDSVESLPPDTDLHISADETVLVLAYSGSGGKGGRDLYIAFRKEGEAAWTEPVHLGNSVNSKGDESRPFLAADQKTLYFASNGLPGFGKYDLFLIRRLDESWTNWSNPINLGSWINTPIDEKSLSVPASGKIAFLSVPGDSSKTDIVRISIPEPYQPDPVLLINGKLIDAATNLPLNAEVRVTSLKNRSSYPLASSSDAKVSLVVPFGHQIGVSATKKGYVGVGQAFSMGEEELEELDQALPGIDQQLGQVEFQQTDINKLLFQLSRLNKELTQLKQSRVPLPDIADANQLVDAEQALSQPAVKEFRETFSSKPQNNRTKPEDLLEKGALPEFSEEKKSLEERYKQQNEQAKKGGETITIEQLEAAEPQALDQLSHRLLPYLYRELGEELSEEVTGELSSTLSGSILKKIDLAAIEAKAIDQLTGTYFPALQKRSMSYIPVLEQYQQGLMGILEPSVRKELKNKLRPQVRYELKNEMSYQVKLQLESEIRAEVVSKLRRETTPGQIVPSPAIKKRSGFREINCELLLVPVEKGAIIPLQNVFFDANLASVKPESYKELDRIRQFLREHPGLVVEIGGYTNGWCSHSFAVELSRERAQFAAEYLIKNGIAFNRIHFRGYGNTNPIASDETPEGRRKNQRLEMKILDIL